MAKLKHIRDIFFDLDHTLWDFDKNSALTFDKIFKINKVDVQLETFLNIYEPLNLEFWKLYREEKIDKQSLRYRRLSETFDQLNYDYDDYLIHKLSQDYIQYLTTFNHLFDDALEILDYLAPNYNLHIITNGFKEVQHGKLNNAGIHHFFKTVTNSEMVGVKKPNPMIFDYALKQSKASKSESIMIGDNYEADILGALNIGLDAICFNYHNEHISDKIKQIKTLKELKQYF
jgi:putative hydrolase of the HAD superfamily